MNQSAQRLIFLLVGLACVVVIFAGVKASTYIINPVLLASMITIGVLPLPQSLMRRGAPTWLALVASILIVVLVLVLVGALLIGSMTKLATTLPSYALESSEDVTPTSSLDLQAIQDQISNVLSASTLSTLGTALLKSVGNLAVTFFMMTMVFIFMISAAISLTPKQRDRFNIDVPIMSKVGQITSDVQRYLSVLTLINFIVGLIDAIFLSVLGVDFAFLWGLLAWFLGYIPAVGFWLALIPPTLLAYVQFGPQTALIVFVGYVLINGSVQNLIQPKMMGSRLSISPVVVFITLLFWSWLLGGAGALLAVPLTLVLISFLESFDPTRWVAVLMRGGAQPQEEREQAMSEARSFWERARDTAGRLGI